MSKSRRAFGSAASNRMKSSRKDIPQYFSGGVAVASIVLGCAWTVYTNVIGASVYPSVNSAAFEAPVIKGTPTVVARRARSTFDEKLVSLEQPLLVMPAPEDVATSLMFNERFAAAAAQGEPSRAIEPQPTEATKLEESSPPAAAPKAVQVLKAAEAARAKTSAPATQLALAKAPKETKTKPTDAKTADDKTATAPPSTSVRDMAQRAKAAVMSIASNDKPNMVEKLWGKQPVAGGLLAYASADASVSPAVSSIRDTKAR